MKLILSLLNLLCFHSQLEIKKVEALTPCSRLRTCVCKLTDNFYLHEKNDIKALKALNF